METRLTQREQNAIFRREMNEAYALDLCYITVDGWCATHSTGEGAVYCDRV